MKEILLCKYGEIVLKGANKSYFEDMLCREIRKRSKKCGKFNIWRSQSTVYIEPLDEEADLDTMLKEVGKVFGIVQISRSAVAEKNFEDITKVALEYLKPVLDNVKTFKVETKRADKTFPMDSMELSKELGGEILSHFGKLKVDVKNPDVTVRLEIREIGAYIHAKTYKGAGGMPVGTNGKGLLLLSGGIDSPVAGFMMAKRGVKLEAIHFESFPYTSELALDKVKRLCRIVSEYAGPVYLHIVSLTEIQQELVKHCDEDYFTLLLRRYMMALAVKTAEKYSCDAIITGESLGQVASQTMQALKVTDILADRPVFRPLVGMDKEEIIQISRKIGAFETSIEPYEDCCTVFTPKHPRTKPELAKVENEENKLNFEELVEKAFETMKTEKISAEEL